MEKWKSIKSHPNYLISDKGKIKSLKYREERILKYSINHAGYYMVSLYTNNFRKSFSVARLVAKEFIPNVNSLPQVNHKNGIKTNNTVENLEWCTASHNIIHSYNMGLQNTP